MKGRADARTETISDRRSGSLELLARAAAESVELPVWQSWADLLGFGSKVVNLHPEVDRSFNRIGLDAEYIHGDIGWEFWCKEGDSFPKRTIELLGNVDAAMFGAITSKPVKAAEAELVPVVGGVLGGGGLQRGARPGEHASDHVVGHLLRGARPVGRPVGGGPGVVHAVPLRWTDVQGRTPPVRRRRISPWAERAAASSLLRACVTAALSRRRRK